MEEQIQHYLAQIIALEEDFFLPLMSDYGFKVSFASGGEFAKKAIQRFAHLESPIQHLEFLRNEIEAMTFEGRAGVYDIVCRDEHRRVFLIEMQSGNYTYFKERVLFYLFQMYNSSIRKGGEGFKDLKPLYCICIVKDSITEFEEWYHKFMIQGDEGKIFSPLLEIHLVELGKFPILREQHHLIPANAELEQIVYTMKYAHTFHTTELGEFPAFWGTSWVQEVLMLLRSHKVPPEEKAMIEVTLATLKTMAADFKQELREAAEKAEKETAKKTEELFKKKAEEAQKEIQEAQKEIQEAQKEIQEEKKRRVIKAIQRGKLSIDEIVEDFEVEKEYVEKIQQEISGN